ncbi:MAG: hypothetical protein GF401_15105 [Chitinivibrionales bacterium]|nr:hypothetical protein [Chitinivibrionales bacterium]
MLPNEILLNADSRAVIQEFDTFDELASASCGYLEQGTCGLSGGNTFTRLFPHWLRQPADYRNTAFFPVDERMVPFDDPQSNWGTAYRNFLAPAGRESDKEHFPKSGEHYREILKNHFHTNFPVFDTLFLGVGDDGHTASLFPRGDYLDDTHSVVLETQSPKPPAGRITLAPRVITDAAIVITIITGPNKKPVTRRIIQKDTALPIIALLSRRKESLLFVQRSLLS